MSKAVEIYGHRQLMKAFRQLGAEVPKEIRRETKELVERIVVPRARERGQQTRANLKGNPTRLGSRGVATIRPEVRARDIAVVMGSARVPYAGGHEWGSKRYRQFPPASRSGYILYPTVKEAADEFARAYVKLVDEMAEKVLPKE